LKAGAAAPTAGSSLTALTRLQPNTATIANTKRKAYFVIPNPPKHDAPQIYTD
jgi:hypothetical protein